MTVGGEDPARSIRELCISWRAALAVPGSTVTDAAVGNFELHMNGVQFHELDFDGLWEATVGLVGNLLLADSRAALSLDHVLLWSWLGELLAEGLGPLSSVMDEDLAPVAQLALRSSLVGTCARDDAALAASAAAFKALDVSSREVLSRAHFLLPYVAFPLLEGVARRACQEYVGLDGKVRQAFQGYAGKRYVVGRPCSSVADVLSLLVESVASPRLRCAIEVLLDHIFEVRGGEVNDAHDGYDVLAYWRNSSAHGESSFRTIGGTVLSLALVISLDSVTAKFDDLKVAALSRAEATRQHWESHPDWFRPQWSYYPPFLGWPVSLKVNGSVGVRGRPRAGGAHFT